MTKFMQEQSEVLSATQELRRQLLAVLTDADLGFRPADGCLPLGELCREIGEVQQTYIESFRTFRNDFSYRHDPEVSRSVPRLAAWYARLDTRVGGRCWRDWKKQISPSASTAAMGSRPRCRCSFTSTAKRC